MATASTKITLVRHGQASFGKANYDELSELGQKQAVLLGNWWQQCGREFSSAWSGSLERQKLTSKLALGDQSVAIDAAFNEYSTETLFVAYKRILDEKVPEIKDSAQPFIDSPAVFFRTLNTLHDAWIAGEEPEDTSGLDFPEFETWVAFRDRIMAGLLRAAESANGEPVVIFTSGGVISLIFQQLLKVSTNQLLEVNWRVANSGMTELQYHPRRGFSLLGFNATPHLDQTGDVSLRTYR